jgi:autotransporter-associated beta strand protein/T5SS/PEP-CTERM-associated repeat protein
VPNSTAIQATIQNGGTATIVSGDTLLPNEMWLGNSLNSIGPAGNGYVTMTGGVLGVSTSRVNWVAIGRGANVSGVFVQSGGTVNANMFVLGSDSTGSTGQYALSGNGTLAVNSYISIGRNASSSGTVTTANNSGVFVGSTGVLLGDSGTGSFTMQDNSLMTDTGPFTLGNAANSRGMGAMINSSSLTVSGQFGVGNNATGGGTMSLGNFATLTTNGNAYIGVSGTGSVSLQDSALWTSNNSNFHLGQNTGSNGILNVSGGTFSRTTTGNIVGNSGSGTITVQGTGLVNINGWMDVGGNANANSVGTILAKDNGSLKVAGDFTIGYTSASLTVQDNALVSHTSGNFWIGRTGATHTTSAVNLNGGTLAVLNVCNNTSTGVATFNFNGGVLLANGAFTYPSAPASTLGNLASYIQTGAAIFNTNGFAVNVAGSLQHSSTLGSTLDGGVAKIGTGTLTLSGNNTYTGPTTLSAGVLSLNNNNALGSGTLTISGGSIDSTAASTAIAGNAQKWNGNFGFLGSQNLDMGTGPVSLGSSVVVNAAQNTLTVGGQIGGSGFGLTKAGGGNLTLGGVNTYTGPTAVNGGTLALGSGASIGTSSGISVGNGATLDVSAVGGFSLTQSMSAGGSGTASVNGSVAAGSNTINLQDGTNLGTLAFGNDLSFGGATLRFDLGQAGNDKIAIAGAASLGSGNTINLAPLFTASSLNTGSQAYTLITAAGGGLNSSFFSLSSSTLSADGSSYNLSLGGDGSQEWLNVTPLAAFTWTGSASTNWSTAANWSSASVPNAAGASVILGSPAANPSVDLGAAAITVGQITIQNAVSTTIQATSGGTLTLDNGGSAATIVAAGTNSITAPLALRSAVNVALASAGDRLTISGGIRDAAGSNALRLTSNNAGTLILTGNNTYAGGTTVNSGTLQLGNPFQNGTLTGNIAVGSTLAFANYSPQVYSGTISGSGTVTMIGAGTLTLNGSNTYSGATTVAAGVLLLGSQAGVPDNTALTLTGGTLDLGGFTKTTSAAVSFQGGTAQDGSIISTAAAFDGQAGAVSANLSGPVGLNKSSAGMLTLSGNNTYGGATTVNAGVLQLGSQTGLPDNTVLTSTGGTLDLGGYTKTTSAAVSFQGGTVQNGSIVSTGGAYNGQSGTVTASLSGAVALNKTTSGMLTLGGNSGYTGNTNLNAGTLAVASDSALGSGTLAITGSSTIAAAGGSHTIANTIYNPLNNGINTPLVVAGTSDLTLSGNITNTGTGYSVMNVVNGDTTSAISTLHLAGGASRSFNEVWIGNLGTAGNLDMSGGSMAVTGWLVMGRLQNTPMSTFTQSGGTVTAANVVLGSDSTGATGVYCLSNTASITATSLLSIGRNAGSNGLVTVANNAVAKISGGSFYVGENGFGTLTIQDNGYLNDTAAPFYIAKNAGSTGVVNLNGGTLAVQSFNPPVGSATINYNGGALRANANFDVPFSVTGNVRAGGAIFDTQGFSVTVNGSLNEDVASTGGGLTKRGSGQLTLGAYNTYTGATSVNAGTLALGTGGAIASSGTISIASGAVFDVTASFGMHLLGSPSQILAGNGSVNGAISADSGSTILPGGKAAIGTLSMGALTLNTGSILKYDFGSGTQDLIKVTNSGGLDMEGGGIYLYQADGTTQFSTVGTYTLMDYVDSFSGAASNLSILNPSPSYTYAINAASGAVVLTISPLVTGPVWNGGGNPTFTWSNTANWSNSQAPTSGQPVNFAGTVGLSNTNNISGLNAAGISFDESSGAFVLSGNSIQLSGAIVNNSSSMQTIAMNLGLTGGDQSLTALSGDLLVSGIIRDGDASHGVILNGPNTVTLAKANTYTGGTTVSAGVLAVGDNAALGSGTLTMVGGAIRSDGAARVLGNPIAASGDFNVNGPLDLTFTGSITSTGTHTMSVVNDPGILHLTGGATWALGQIGAGNGAIAGNLAMDSGALNVANAFLLGQNGAAGSFTQSGGTVTAGYLSVGSGSSSTGTMSLTGAAAVFATGSAFIGENGTGSFAMQDTTSFTNSGGTFAIGQNAGSSGTMTVSGGAFTRSASANSYIGNSGNGTLIVQGPGAVNINGWLDVGSLHTGSQGSILVAGNGALTVGGDFTIGYTTGSLTLQDSASVTETAGNFYIGRNGGGATHDSSSVNLIGGTLSVPNINIYTGVGSAVLTFDGGMLRATGAFSSAVPITINGGGGTVNTNGNIITLSGIISSGFSAGALTKNGSGTMTLSNNSNSFTGDLNVNAGVVIASGAGGGFNSTLGAANVSRNIWINSGGTLQFNSADTFGNATLTSPPAVIVNVNGGLVATSGANLTTFGAVNLTNGTMTAGGGDVNWHTFQFRGTVTSNGTSTINMTATAGTNAATCLTNPATDFDVADGLLSVSMPLVNGYNVGACGLTKTGSGTLVLSGTNTYTGKTTVNDGTLVLTNSQAVRDGANLYVGDPTELLMLPAPVIPAAAVPSFSSSAPVAPVPEPATLTLLAAAIAGAITYRRLKSGAGRN